MIDPLHRLIITRQGQRVRVSAAPRSAMAVARTRAHAADPVPGAVGLVPGQGADLLAPGAGLAAPPMLPDGAPGAGRQRRGRPVAEHRPRRLRLGRRPAAARALADAVAARAPAVDLQPFALTRF